MRRVVAGAAAALVAMAGLCGGADRAAAHTVVAPAAVRHPVSVWLAYWNMSAALDSAVANSDVIGTASPFWYAIAGDSTIQDDPGAGQQSVVDALRASSIRVIPTVTETEDLSEFDRTLASAARRSAMVHALLTIARGGEYSGLDLDFEDFAVDRGHDGAAADAAAMLYPGFVAQVCGALHAIGESCTVTVMPRTSAAQVYWRGELATWVYDYGALAGVADRVRVMAYDDNAPGGPAGPVAPYAWVEQVVGYAKSTMPGDKVQLALPAYGYDWSGSQATSITSQQAPLLAAAHGATPAWSTTQKEYTFTYTVAGHMHTVWYEDATAEYDRALLARGAGFAGIDLWTAGDEDPALWPLLRALYLP